MRCKVLEYTPKVNESGNLYDYNVREQEPINYKRYIVLSNGNGIVDLKEETKRNGWLIQETKVFKCLSVTPKNNPNNLNSNVWQRICRLDEILFQSDSLEECLSYLREHGCQDYYVKLDHRLDKWYGENKGKLSSEIYPRLRDNLSNIQAYTKEVFYTPDEKKYKDYFGDDYKPFVVEVWKRCGSSLQLQYIRKNENEEFSYVNY